MSELLETENLPVTAVEVLPSVMSQAEARQCIEAIKEYAVSLRRLLVELEDRRGWSVLGYSSMTACMVAEFNNSKPVLVRELKVGRIEKYHLQVPIGTYLESQLRPLSKLSSAQQYQPTVVKAHQLAGEGRLSAAHVRQAVNETLSPLRKVKQTLPSKYLRNDLVRIQCQVGALQEQKAWNGCWGIVHSTGNISNVRVLVANQEVDYMAGDLDWDINSEPQFRDACARVLNLWQQTDLEPVEENLLKFFQRRPFFTELEEQMISLMESKRPSSLTNKQLS